MIDLLLLLLMFIGVLCTVAALALIVAHGRRQKQLRKRGRTRALLAEQERISQYIRDVDQARSDEELERLAQENEKKWDGLS